MHCIKIVALAGALVLAAFLSHGSVEASPLAAGPMAGVNSNNGLIDKAWHYGRPHYRPRRYYGRPYNRGYRPRVVCRIEYRTVRTRYGRVVRRPVEVCRRRF